MQLAQSFKKSNSNTRRKVQTPNPAPIDRYLYHISWVGIKQLLGQTSRFGSKYQAVSGQKRKIIVRPGNMGRKIDQAPGPQFHIGSFKIWMEFHANIGPVIESSSFELLVGNLKTEWTDKVERSVGGCACPCDVAGILRYFRLIKQHAELFAQARKGAAMNVLRIATMLGSVVDQSRSSPGGCHPKIEMFFIFFAGQPL